MEEKELRKRVEELETLLELMEAKYEEMKRDNEVLRRALEELRRENELLRRGENGGGAEEKTP
ncbi:hypothetical protein [Thermococcus sp.]|uniref:hypothetical protein n=1 Tax=Thermococcus sp. TaxID=35749 RepID=UPI0025F62076|nr:hypothetical protein [Thermococcus sp.]